MAEVDAVLKAAPAEPKSNRPLRIILVSGPKDHGIDEHDYPLWQERWAKLLGFAEGVTISTARVWPSKDDLAKGDVLVWFSANPGWSVERAPELDAFLARGGGMVYLHYAVNGRAAPEALAQRIGLAWRDGHSQFRHGPLDLTFPQGDKNPITAGFRGLHLVDESYWELLGDPAKVEILATGPEEGKPRPLLWTHRVGRGRVFCSIPGHYSWTFDDPLFRLLILRGIAWSAGEPINRYQELATLGARIQGPEAK
jgi:type 1 glutamine amidotransferase